MINLNAECGRDINVQLAGQLIFLVFAVSRMDMRDFLILVPFKTSDQVQNQFGSVRFKNAVHFRYYYYLTFFNLPRPATATATTTTATA